jgi:3-methyl-2-oxobutanoate hydroxymethyltransferase
MSASFSNGSVKALARPKRMSAPAIAARKASRPSVITGFATDVATSPAPTSPDRLVMVTAYDAPSAKIAHRSGVDLILVGDSLAMVVLGHDDTLSVTVEEMAHHIRAVARGLAASEASGCAETRPLVVGDMPWMSYHVSVDDTVRNAAALMRAGAGCVKLEGGAKRVPMVAAIIDAEIPVMGHIGLTPQSVNALGGFKVQGKTIEAVDALIADARALEAAGCFAIVLEAVPDAVARLVTDAVSIPTIGIGAGPHCDGQVLVWHDLLGIEDRVAPKFVRRYDDQAAESVNAVRHYASDVRSGAFPGPGESYAAGTELTAALLDRADATNDEAMADAAMADHLVDLDDETLIALYA